MKRSTLDVLFNCANDSIGLHLSHIADGQTYADLGEPQSDLRARVAAAEGSGDAELASLTTQLADVTSQRETLFKGETLRGPASHLETIAALEHAPARISPPNVAGA